MTQSFKPFYCTSPIVTHHLGVIKSIDPKDRILLTSFQSRKKNLFMNLHFMQQISNQLCHFQHITEHQQT